MDGYEQIQVSRSKNRMVMSKYECHGAKIDGYEAKKDMVNTDF